MLMFDSGIFASFIPQILMVLGYVSCLIAPKIFVEKNSIAFEVTEINITTIQEPVISEKTAFYFEYNLEKEIIEKSAPILCFYDQYTTVKIPCRKIYLNAGLSFSRFSRPPPAYFA